jgi:hypothetical protein
MKTELGDKPKMSISFSGGRTSAVMTKMLLEKHRNTHDILVTFANTGCEHIETLNFVRNCDVHFGFNTVWLEAVVSHGDKVGIRHKIVTFENASRKGEPFEEYIKKYGIPTPASPTCTSRLKEDVMRSYIRSMGWKRGTYLTAIGIRADEVDRMSSSMNEQGLIYPLVKAFMRKEDILSECRKWPFDLNLDGEHYGNCVWCWKKSLRKLLTVAKHHPEHFDFPKKMDSLYGKHKLTAATTSPQGDRRFFRNHLNTADIILMAKGEFNEYIDRSEMVYDDPLFDVGAGCGESCEIGSDN